MALLLSFINNNNNLQFYKMKKITFIVLLSLFSFQMFSQSKVGTIDIDFILSKMPDLEKVNTDLNTYGTELENEVKSQIASYQALVKTYQEKESGYTDPMKKIKQDEIIKKEEEVQNLQQNASKLLQIKQNELMRPLYKTIGENLSVISKEQGYGQVLTINNTIAYLDPALDLTIPVMKKMGLPTE